MMGFEEIFQLLILAALVLLYRWSHRSFPPQQTAELIHKLSEASRRTETRLDDMLVEIARVLHELRQEESELSDP